MSERITSPTPTQGAADGEPGVNIRNHRRSLDYDRSFALQILLMAAQGATCISFRRPPEDGEGLIIVLLSKSSCLFLGPILFEIGRRHAEALEDGTEGGLRADGSATVRQMFAWAAERPSRIGHGSLTFKPESGSVVAYVFIFTGAIVKEVYQALESIGAHLPES